MDVHVVVVFPLKNRESAQWGRDLKVNNFQMKKLLGGGQKISDLT